MTDLTLLTRYRDNIISHARKVLDKDVSLTLHGIPQNAYGTVPPVDALRYPYTEFLCERFITESAMIAEKNGYDAYTIGCYLDPGLDKARSLVDIPVLGIADTAMLVSCTLGKKFAFITIAPSMQEHLWEEAIANGLEKRVAAILAIDPPVNEYQMEGDPEQGALVERLFLESCDKAIAAGADVIVPGEGVINEFLFDRGLRSYKSIPVLDGNAILWQYAVMSAKLHQTSGIVPGRRMVYKKPPSDLLEKLQGVQALYHLKESDFS